MAINQVFVGDVRDFAAQLELQSVPYFGIGTPYYGIIGGMEKHDGRIKKGERRGPSTEFKAGQHWRPPQPFREKAWLEREYVKAARSTKEIAAQCGVSDGAIFFWLKKHGIPRRTMSQVRAVKHWGAKGTANPMYGKRGASVPAWKGGVTPERQAVYSSLEWAEASKTVWQRDRGTCQRCGAKANDGATLNLHHIVSFAVVALRTEPTNLVLLCVTCHRFVHSASNVARDFIKEA